MSRVAFWTLCGSLLGLIIVILGLVLTVSGLAIAAVITSGTPIPTILTIGPQAVVVGIVIGLTSGLIYRLFARDQDEHGKFFRGEKDE